MTATGFTPLPADRVRGVQFLLDLVELAAQIAEFVEVPDTDGLDLDGRYQATTAGRAAYATMSSLRGAVHMLKSETRLVPSRFAGTRTVGQALRVLADRQDRMDYACEVETEDDEGNVIPPHELYPFLTASRAEDDTVLETEPPVKQLGVPATTTDPLPKAGRRCRAALLAAVAAAAEPPSRKQLVAALRGKWGKSSVCKAAADLVRSGLLRNARDHSGYTLPATGAAQ